MSRGDAVCVMAMDLNAKLRLPFCSPVISKFQEATETFGEDGKSHQPNGALWQNTACLAIGESWVGVLQEYS